MQIDDRQQRGADNTGIRVGLYDTRGRCCDIEVGGAGFFNDLGQLARAESAPPVERRRSRLRRGSMARAQAVGGRNIEPWLRLAAGEQAAAQRQCYAYTLQHHPKRAPPSLTSRLLCLSTPMHSKSFRNPAVKRLGCAIILL